MASCDLSDTDRNKVELVFNIRKRDRFQKSQFSFEVKQPVPPKIANLDVFRLIQRIST